MKLKGGTVEHMLGCIVDYFDYCCCSAISRTQYYSSYCQLPHIGAPGLARYGSVRLLWKRIQYGESGIYINK